MMAPSFLVDNEFILRGYRINFNTKRKICRSLFLLHNETVNVWSHILGVLAFIGLLIWSLAGLHASSIYKEILNGDPHYFKDSFDNRREL